MFNIIVGMLLGSCGVQGGDVIMFDQMFKGRVIFGCVLWWLSLYEM
jgi:hypothetical protein